VQTIKKTPGQGDRFLVPHITKPVADKLLDYCEWIIKDKYSCKL